MSAAELERARAAALEILRELQSDRRRHSRADRFFAWMFGISIRSARARAWK